MILVMTISVDLEEILAAAQGDARNLTISRRALSGRHGASPSFWLCGGLKLVVAFSAGVHRVGTQKFEGIIKP